MTGPRYVELQATSHFSFLRGASSAEELFAQAAMLGIEALGIVDRNSLAGIVRAHEAAKATGVRLVVGCRLDLADGFSLLVYPTDRAAYARLCRLLSEGKRRAGKAKCHLEWRDVVAYGEGLIAILLPDDADALCAERLCRLREAFGDRGYLALTLRRRPNDQLRLHELANLAASLRVETVVTNDVLFHEPRRRIMQDVVTAIRHNVTIDTLGFRRERHADRFLKPPEEMHRLFARYPEALARTLAIAKRCTFSMSELEYQYPEERSLPDLTPQEALEKFTWERAAERYPEGVPDRVSKILAHELALIRTLDYAPYFLTVNAIVRFARSKGILCQGRGSAANSAVCYVLGITSIDPDRNDLLFERFVSVERKEPPDIDVDFEHERREEVIQWVYETYGRDRAALCSTVIRYRSKGALRDVGKALGLTEDTIKMLSGQVWGWSRTGIEDKHAADLNMNLGDRRLRLALDLARALIGTPRHLSQHPGGFVLTRDRLDDLVPIEPAAMAGRQVVEWDKDDVDALRMMKMDCLALGMLSCMKRAFDLLSEHKGIALDLATNPAEDPRTYAMIRRADTLGVFQIESRAQMSMLPRLKPRTFYDLVIEVAIVRPGPIQGDMVHPYLRRREGKEDVVYPTPELEAVLGKTLGVPLFQEQAMRIAITAAGFTPGEADQLRRNMATFKHTGGVSAFKNKLVNGMIDNGYARDFAEKTFSQLEGFGSYGFPESHAASFALLAYASSWMKCHHADVFCAALLNAQPMGFYAPAQIIAARGDRSFSSVDDLWCRAAVPAAALVHLADADAFRPAFSLPRRDAMWAIKALRDEPLPLFAAAAAREARTVPEIHEPAVALRPMKAGGEVVEDYGHVGLTLRAHPLSFLRADLARRRVVTCTEAMTSRDGRWLEAAGLVLVRQMPGSAKGLMFITIEDESGIANLVIWPQVFERYRRVVLSAGLLSVRGRIQREGEVVHLVARHLSDLSGELSSVGERDDAFPLPHGRGDELHHGSPTPDRRGLPKGPQPRNLGNTYGHIDQIRVKTRDFK